MKYKLKEKKKSGEILSGNKIILTGQYVEDLRRSSKKIQIISVPILKKKKSISIVFHCSERCSVSPIRCVLGRDSEQRDVCLLKQEEDSVLWFVWVTFRD